MSEIHEHVVALATQLRTLLARPQNDLAWSHWKNTEAALSEFDAAVASGDTQTLLFLLAPTNSLQEVSLSSGWGDEFVHIANAIDGLLR